jgi:hypothetical protein
MNRIRRIVVSIVVALGFAVPALVPAVASAAPEINQNLCNGANLSFSESANCEGTGTDEEANAKIDAIITNVINILSLAVGVVSVIMIIVGGFRYVTSSGESSNVTSAKNTILYAVVGLVVVAIAQIIVRVVVNKVTTPVAT